MKSRRSGKDDSSLRSYYRRSFGLIGASREYIVFAFLLLMCSAIVGFLFPSLFEEQMIEIIRNMVKMLEGKTAFELIVGIFINNLSASFFGMVFGIMVGVYPIVAALINGYVIGFASQLAVSEAGISVLWRLVPHGIFEIPAILLSLGIGLYLGSSFIERKFRVKSVVKRMSIMCGVVVVLIPFFAAYTVLASRVTDVSSFSAFVSGGDVFVLGILALCNLAVLCVFFFIGYCFVKDSVLKKRFVDAVVCFGLIVLPLLILAGVIEGILVSLF